MRYLFVFLAILPLSARAQDRVTITRPDGTQIEVGGTVQRAAPVRQAPTVYREVPVQQAPVFVYRDAQPVIRYSAPVALYAAPAPAYVLVPKAPPVAVTERRGLFGRRSVTTVYR